MHSVRGVSLLPLLLLLSRYSRIVTADESSRSSSSPPEAQTQTQTRDSGRDATPSTTSSPKATETKDHFFSFVSRPDLQAPVWDIRYLDTSATAPGYWFIAPYDDVNSRDPGEAWVGPYIYDQNGELIWSGTTQFKNYNNHDFRVAQVGNEAMLTVIYEHEVAGVVLNPRYERHRTIRVAADVEGSNMHEFNLVANGAEALVLTGDAEYANQKALAMQGFAVDTDGYCRLRYEGFKELDAVGSEEDTLEAWKRPTFVWKASEHVRLGESSFVKSDFLRYCNDSWDLMHSNSLDKFPDGDYLLSARHTDTLYKVSHIDGSIVWRLGGKDSDFVMTTDTLFSRQHHARVLGQNDTHAFISLFDNAIGTGPDEAPTRAYSRGLLLTVQTTPGDLRVEMIAGVPHPHGRRTNSRGSFQILPNGNAFVGWTYSTLITESTPEGEKVLEACLRAPLASYRSYKFEWTGFPAEPIAVVSTTINDGQKLTTVAYTSWNGATEVASWNLYKTNDDGSRKIHVNSVKRHGFETALVYEGFAQYVIVEAVGYNGTALGRSEITRTLSTADHLSPAFVSEAQWLEDEAELRYRPDEQSVGFAFGFLSCLFALALIILLQRLWRRGGLPKLLRSPRFRPLRSEDGEDDEKLGILSDVP